MSNPKKKPTKKTTFSSILAVLAALVVLFLGGGELLPGDENLPETQQPISTSVQQETATEAPQTQAQQPIIAPQAIADYLFTYGELPDNFLTKNEAKALGWDSSKNYVSDVAPGYSIGGDRFGNYEELLPDASGRKWYEADANYTSGPRGAERVVYSSDGLVYYTDDHYASFEEMQPSGK